MTRADLPKKVRSANGLHKAAFLNGEKVWICDLHFGDDTICYLENANGIPTKIGDLEIEIPEPRKSGRRVYEKLEIDIDIVAAKFIVTAILFQNEGGVIFEDDTPDADFLEYYGFSRKQLAKSLDLLRKQIPLNKSIRERMLDGEFEHGEITVQDLLKKV